MSTDIDALIAEARDWQRRWSQRWVTPGTEVLVGNLIDALTTERARVVELEAFRNGYKDYFRKLQDSVEAERAKVAALEAEVARWREVAGEMAGAFGETLAIAKDFVPVPLKAPGFKRADAALARFKQESGK
jgi:hypothetical protein